ncbi:MAG: protein phosphatase 2C domain-containing protein [Thermomicrobiales bacterium]
MSIVPRGSDAPAETLRLAVAARSEAAGRAENQDVAMALALPAATGAPAEDFLLLVADGMGGAPAGDVASHIAANTLRDAFEVMPEGDLGRALKGAYRKANDAVFAASQASPERAGMGTTLTTALLHGKYATIANVGDSRAYLLRGGGLTQITRDHTVVADDVAAGKLKPAEARTDARRNQLTHVLGTQARLDTRLPGIFELTLLPGDRLLLCSDGLYDPLDQVDIQRVMLAQEVDAAAIALVDLARERGTTDNATAVVAVAVPTRVPAAGVIEAIEHPTGGKIGTTMIAVIAVLVLLLTALALYVLVFSQ